MIPDKIKIGAVTYPVLQNCDDELLKKDYLGECGYRDCTIKILSTLPQQRKEQAFIHEVVHLLLFEAGFTWNVYDNERMVRQIANILYQILRDNKIKLGD